MKSPTGSSKKKRPPVHGSEARSVDQPAGYEIEIPCMADVNVSVNGGPDRVGVTAGAAVGNGVGNGVPVDAGVDV